MAGGDGTAKGEVSVERQLTVQEIASKVKEVPAEFVVGEEVQRTLQRGFAVEEELPLIDLTSLLNGSSTGKGAADPVKAAIGKACEEFGFFQVVNHGIPESLVKRALEVVRGFFDLPVEEKLKYSVKQGPCGSKVGYGQLVNWKTRPWFDTLRHSGRPSPTPDQDVRPTTPAEYREVMDKYAEAVAPLAQTLTAVFSEYLGLESDALKNALSKTKSIEDFPSTVISSNFYPECPEPDRVVGIFPHSDAGAMTVLCQEDHVAGLQVLQGSLEDGKWITVKPKKNALIINIANQLEILTNGKFKSAQHRAVVNTESRVSIATFCIPASKDLMIGPLPQLAQDAMGNSTAQYPTTSFGDYYAAALSKIYDTNSLNSNIKGLQPK